MLYLLVFFSSLLITVFATPFLINFLTRLNIVDVPGGRRINTKAIPRMGGILIYAIIVLALLNYTSDFKLFRFVILSSVLLALCGILDDLKELRWHFKYLLHSLSAVVIMGYLYPLVRHVEFFGTDIFFPFDIILIFLFITGSINALNMLDGMDGLVSGFSLLLFMLIFILSFSVGDPFLMILSAASIGSLIGFLKFNANPARIFLGDTGSLLLGFFLVFSAMMFSIKFYGYTLDLGFPIILLGVPLFDTLRVITIRIWNGTSPFKADNNHIHHMISGNNIRHKTTVFIIQAFTVFFILLSVVYLYYNRVFAYTTFCFSGLILFNLRSIMQFFHSFENVKNIVFRLLEGDIFTIDLYKKYLLPFSSLIVAVLLFLFLPEPAHIPTNILILISAICILLFAASYISSRREHRYNDLYILLNLTIFFSLTAIAKPLYSYNAIMQNKAFIYLGTAALAAIILLFILSKHRLFHEEKVLLSGLDMILLVMVLFLYVAYNIIPFKGLNFIHLNLQLSFTIYLWYKILVFLVPKYTRPVYYFTFALPVISLIVISM